MFISPEKSSYKWWAAFAILLGQVTLAFGMFAVSVALPRIMTALSAEVNLIQWVMTGFLIARTLPMPAIGWMSTLLSNRQLYIVSLIAAILSTLLCSLSWNIESLIFFRVLQGLSGAPAQTIGMVLLYQIFPPGQRGLAMGMILLAGSLGPTVGPSLGGYLIQEWSWRAIFWLGIPPGILGVILTILVIPDTEKPTERSIDLFGLLTMSIFLITLLLGLTQGQKYGWDSTYIFALFTIALCSFLLFVSFELLQDKPLLDLRLYKNVRFCIVSLVVFLYNAGFFGANFLIAIMLQRVFLFTPLQTGMVLAPGALIMGLMGVLAGQLSDKIDPRIPMLTGLLCFFGALYAFSITSLNTSLAWFTVLVIFQRVAFGCIQSPISSVVLKTLSREHLNMGSGLHGVHRGIASAFGVTLASLLLEQRLAVHRLLSSESHDLSSVAIRWILPSIQASLQDAGEVPSLLRTQTFQMLRSLMERQVEMTAYQDIFLVLSLLFLLALIPTALIKIRAGSSDPKTE